MKLFTKGIDKKLFAQFPKGGSLEGQKVIAKVFNPYGRGRWYIMNSDPNDPDYLWGIVQLFDGEPEVGSFSREELENIKVGAFKLPLERDLYFDERDAMQVYNGLKSGKTFEDGGEMDNRRTLRLSDAVLYKGKMYTLIKRNNEIGFVSYEQGAWGSNGIFIPLSKMFRSDLEENLTTMQGNKFNIPSYDELMEQPYGFMEHGGEIDDEGVDLFEDYEDQPEEVSVILSKYEVEDNDYDILEQLLAELEEIGYTFEYGLDAEPYDLRKIGQKGKSEFYALGGTLNLLDPIDTYKANFFYGGYKGAIGSFAWRGDNRNYNEGVLFPLDDFDKDFYSHIQMKDGEALFRYKTEIMGDNFFPLIKVNFDRMVVHFIDDATDEKNPKFYRRGTPLIYLTLERYYYEVREFAKGGKLLTTRQRYIAELKGLSGLSQKALDDFIDENKLSDNEILNLVIGLGRKQIERTDFVTAIVGNKNNEEFIKVMTFIKSDKAMRAAKGGKLQYTSKRNITNVTIKYEGKEYVVSGDDVITGAYKFAKGGLSDTHIYIPKRDVVKISTKEGESINSPLNGVWVKKEYFDGKEAKRSGSYEPSQATKGVADKLKDFKKDKSITASVKDDIIYNLSFEDGFVSDLKYEIENNISGLAIETYANAVKSVSKKNKLRVAKNLAYYGNSNALNLFPESFTKTPLLTKKAISMKGNLFNNTAFLSELGKFTSDDALRPAMTAIRFDGKSVVATDANVLVHIYQDVSVEPKNLCVTKICETSKGEDSRYPDWKAIIARDLNDSKYSSATFDLDKLIVLTNWINNYNSVFDNFIRSISITTDKGEISFNPELLLKTLTMLKVIGMSKPILYFESNNRPTYFGKEGQLSGDATNDNFVLLMPLYDASTETFSLDIRNNEYKIVVPEFKKEKGGKLSEKGQLNLFEN